MKSTPIIPGVFSAAGGGGSEDEAADPASPGKTTVKQK